MPIATLLEKGLLTVDQCDAWNLSHSAFIITLMKFDPDYIDVMSSKGDTYIRGYVSTRRQVASFDHATEHTIYMIVGCESKPRVLLLASMTNSHPYNFACWLRTNRK